LTRSPDSREIRRSRRPWPGWVYGSLLLAIVVSLPSLYAQTTATEPLAEVNGEAITATELEHSLGEKLSQLEEQIYKLKREELDSLIAQRLLAQEAKKRGISVTALLDAEVTSKVTLVTEGEIDAFYQANRAGLRGDEATVRQQIRTFLQKQKLTARRDVFVRTLRAQARVVDRLQPPPINRVKVSSRGAPFKGGENAPVTIVEFSDFHCPFCKKVLPTLAQIESKYRDKVKLVFRDFPIESLHPEASKAHEAARCAGEQGKFWPYHDKLFAGPASSSPELFNRFAKEVGLEVATFETCLSSGKHQAAIKKDIEEGQRLGVAGTPAFFINGRLFTGAQPLEAFARVIDEELARIK